MASTSPLTRESIFRLAQTLPPEPKALARLGELFQDVNTGIDEVASLIKRDASLTARIIRIGNSVVYGGATRIGSIEEALNRVGFNEVYRIVGLLAGSLLASRPLHYYQLGTEPLRENMLLTALMSEALAVECGIDPRYAYTAGLLRTLGILVLDRIAERLPEVKPYDHARHGSYLVWEGISFGLGNGEVAAMVLNDWRFPPEIVNAIRDHYLTRAEDYENRSACLLNLAGRMVAEAGHTLPGDRRYWELTPHKLEVIGLREDQMQAAGDRAREVFFRLRSELH